jgi:hypothetical protein
MPGLRLEQRARLLVRLPPGLEQRARLLVRLPLGLEQQLVRCPRVRA